MATQFSSQHDVQKNSGNIIASPQRRKETSATALKLFLRVTDRWGLNGEEQRGLLGDIPRSTFQRWKREIEDASFKGELSRDQIERISYCLGIDKGLQLVFAKEASGLEWLSGENRDNPFHGQPPIDRMIESGIVGLHDTRTYLDAWRGIR